MEYSFIKGILAMLDKECLNTTWTLEYWSTTKRCFCEFHATF